MASPGKRLSLQRRRLAIEYEDGSDAVKQKLANSMEQTQQVGVGYRVSTAVTETFHSLYGKFG